MKSIALAAAALLATLSLVACQEPVQRVQVPGPEEPAAYKPVPMMKPLPQENMGQAMPTGMQPGVAPTIMNEDAFVTAYVNHRSPRIMVFVNRTIQGDPLSKDSLMEVIRAEDPHRAPNAVNATSDDYEMVEASLVRYFDNSGKVQVKDSDLARSKLTREQLLRIENNDPAANRLLAVELQQDILIRVSARPSTQTANGPGIRFIAKAVSTTDARNLGTAFVDMPPPLSKTNINISTRYLAEELMGQMAHKWAQAPEFDPIEVRVYKAAGVEDTIRIRDWLKATGGVTQVRMQGATGGAAGAYAVLNVGFSGAPEDLYGGLKEAIGQSQGLKAVDLQNNTITLEVTGVMNLVPTTLRSETHTVTETRTTVEEKSVEPISPAPVPQ